MIALALAFAVVTVTPSVRVVEGPVNGVLVQRQGKVLAVYGDPRGKVAAEKVLITHARRDVVWAAEGARGVVAPEGEVQYLSAPGEYWRSFWDKERFHDYANQVIRWPVRGMQVERGVKGGDRIEWEGLAVEVMDTPGYTRGSVSYLMVVDGKRIACTGDLIYGDGRLMDLYSLQDAIPELKVRGYHGYAARAGQLVESLKKVAAWKPDVIVPARGPVIRDPQASIERLIGRVQAVYANYLRTDAYRWYFGDDNWRARARRVVGDAPVEWMASAEISGKTPPSWIKPIGNSRLVLSSSGAALLMDAGYRRIQEELRKRREAGEFLRLEEIHITHYHDDHTDFAQATAEEFGAVVVSSPQQSEILAEPERFRMPCLTPNAIRNLKVMKDGESRRWHEFKLTKFAFPGQTIYHDGLLVEKDGGEAVFFAGDSFTPTGLDDYCLLNRNPIRDGVGFLKAIGVLKKLPAGTHVINQHVMPTFRFSAGQLDEMERSLRRRGELLKELVPWEEVNFVLDEQWVRLDPHGRSVKAGDEMEFRVVVMNHGQRRAQFTVTPKGPAGWKMPVVTVDAPARGEGVGVFRVKVPPDADGLQFVTADVRFGRWDLREWCEALVTVQR